MITSTGNAQVKELVRLMKKRKARDEAGVFLVEGPRMTGELLEDPEWRGQIEKVWMSESYARRHESGANAGEKATACRMDAERNCSLMRYFPMSRIRRRPRGSLLLSGDGNTVCRMFWGKIRERLWWLSLIICRTQGIWGRSSGPRRRPGRPASL